MLLDYESNKIRQKIIHCGKYGKKAEFIEVDLIPYYGEREKGKVRGEKINVSTPKQKNLNDSYARRYFCQLVKSNFTENDYFISLNYNNSYLPKSVEEAEKQADNYIRRIKNKCKSLNIPMPKYVYVTEQGSKGKRIHHHMIISVDLPPATLKDLWRKPKKKGEKKGELIGRIRLDLLSFDPQGGIEALAEYLRKDPLGRKRWRQSQGLIKPWYKPNDKRYTKKKIDYMAGLPSDCEFVKQYWERQYKGYELYECKNIYNKETCRWAIYLKMRLRI